VEGHQRVAGGRHQRQLAGRDDQPHVRPSEPALLGASSAPRVPPHPATEQANAPPRLQAHSLSAILGRRGRLRVCSSPHCAWPRREFHPDLLPGHISALRRPAAPVQGPPSATPEMVRDVAVHLVLHDLEPVRAVERVGFRAFLVKHATAAPTRRPLSCPGLASAHASRPRRSAAPRPRYPRALGPRRPAPGLRSSSGAAVQGALDTVLGDIGRQVAELVSAAKDSGCRFVIQGDTWKPRKRGGGGAALTGSLPVPARLGIPEASPSQARSAWPAARLVCCPRVAPRHTLPRRPALLVLRRLDPSGGLSPRRGETASKAQPSGPRLATLPVAWLWARQVRPPAVAAVAHARRRILAT
jgi:hypothetical protein